MTTEARRAEARKAGRLKHPMVEAREHLTRVRTHVPASHMCDGGGNLIPVGAEPVFEPTDSTGEHSWSY